MAGTRRGWRRATQAILLLSALRAGTALAELPAPEMDPPARPAASVVAASPAEETRARPASADAAPRAPSGATSSAPAAAPGPAVAAASPSTLSEPAPRLAAAPVDAGAAAPPLAMPAGPVAAPRLTPPVDAPQRAAARTAGPHVLGLQIDGGVPDGASATLLYRPWRYLRLGGGMLYNYVGYGILGSASIAPYYPIAPSFTLEAGHFFDANAQDKIARFTTVSDNVKPLLQRVGYTFVNAHVGLEFGHQNWCVFFIRAGLSRVWLSAHDADKAVVRNPDGSTVTFADPSARLGIPSAKVGFMFFFL